MMSSWGGGWNVCLQLQHRIRLRLRRADYGGSQHHRHALSHPGDSDQAGLTTAQGQYQVLLNLSTGTYRLRNRATGNCLSGAQLSKTPGLPLTDAPYSALPHQDWILDPLGGGAFQLINQWSGLVIDTQGGGTATGTPLVQNVNTGAATQRWQFAYSTWYPKKGIGGTSFATAFNANWMYNWGMTNSQSLPAGAVFNPMQWGDYNWDIGSDKGPNWQYYPAWRTKGEALHHMGFNEPDAWSQSGRSLDPTNPATEAAFSSTRSMQEAVLLWPRLQAMDAPLVAPCPANMSGGWLSSFYTQANALGYRVDYTANHSYPSPNGIEFFLGGTSDTTGFTPLPGVTVTITDNDVTYSFPAGTPKFARLKVTGP